MLRKGEEMLDKNSILVLGGSFNPPTIAHVQLVIHAMEHTHAGTGIFVPSSDNYVRRKCKKLNEDMIFSEDDRKKMLDILIKHVQHDNLLVELGEYGDDGRGRSYDTIVRIQNQYPDRKCAFIIGADKLSIIPRWHNGDNFFKEFYFVVVSRDHADTEKIIESNEKLSRYRNKLILIPPLPDYYDGISSTYARHLLKQEHTVMRFHLLEKILTFGGYNFANNWLWKVEGE